MTTPDSQVMNYVVRMVVPMRREFGRSLDVARFMSNPTYAREVLRDAAQSRDPRLREYALQVLHLLSGGATPPPPAPPVAPPAAPPSAPMPLGPPTEPGGIEQSEAAKARAKFLQKYKGGLR